MTQIFFFFKVKKGSFVQQTQSEEDVMENILAKTS